jgi:peroxiredoxin
MPRTASDIPHLRYPDYLTRLAVFMAFLLGAVSLPSASGALDKRLLDAAGVHAVSGKAVDFALVDPEGRVFRLKDLRGSPVILHVWATWCRACEKEFPAMDRLHGEIKDRKVSLLAVAIDRSLTRAEVEAHARGLGAGFPVYLARDGDMGSEYWTWGVPATYFIDGSGRVAARRLGPLEWDSVGVKDLIDALVEGLE